MWINTRLILRVFRSLDVSKLWLNGTGRGGGLKTKPIKRSRAVSCLCGMFFLPQNKEKGTYWTGKTNLRSLKKPQRQTKINFGGERAPTKAEEEASHLLVPSCQQQFSWLRNVSKRLASFSSPPAFSSSSSSSSS